MNGRLYDPVVGRFLSPDPYIIDPSFSQSYNRYSYCLNNPLKFTDYSGEKLNWPKFEWFHAIPLIGQFDYMMQMLNDNTPQLRQNMVNAKVPNFGVNYNTMFGAGFSVGDNPAYYPFYENRIVEGQQRVELNLENVRQAYGAAWFEATNIEKGIYYVNTISSVQNNLIFNNITIEMGLAFYDFQRNYLDMRQANWLNSDKYFHAKANFQASNRGPFGSFFAEHFSNLREIWDQRIKGYERFDSLLDQKANRYGRDQSKYYGPNDFRKALETYRPKNLPDKY